MPAQPPFDDEQLMTAAEWIVQSQEPDFSLGEAALLDRWLDAAPAHRAAYLSLLRVWDAVPQHPELAARFPLQQSAPANDRSATTPITRRPIRRRWLAGVVAGAMAASAAFLLLRGPADEAPRHYETGFGQISRITMSDGSVATLGPRSRFDVHFLAGERHVGLAAGEAFFEIAKNPARPFTVDLGSSSIRVVGTKFNVLRGDAAARVAVVQGIVQLRSGAARPDRALLGALHRGQLADITPGPRGDPLVRTSSFDPGGSSADAVSGGWRDGWLAYENTPLREILSDVNRYYAPGVTLAQSDLGDLRLTASFRHDAVPQFIETLGPSLAITVVRLPTGGYRLERAQPHR